MSSLMEIQAGSGEPLYNIGVVSRMTGISMAALRAWDRRYDFPESKRSVGGHRLYSERDIIRLRWVKQRVDGGMQTAQAIHALRHQEQTGQPILTEGTFDKRKQGLDEQFYALAKLESGVKPSYFASLRERLMVALINREPQSADEMLAEALALISPEGLMLGIIRSVLNEIGEQWEQGKINVATEHFATNYLRQRLMMWMVSSAPARGQHTILLACAPDEWHDGSLLILGALLRRRLWPVIYLGQAVPLQDLANFAQEANPSLMALIAMTEETAANLVDWNRWLPDVAAKSRPIVGFGGRIFVEKPEWRLNVPGIYLGNTLEEGVSTIEKLLRS